MQFSWETIYTLQYITIIIIITKNIIIVPHLCISYNSFLQMILYIKKTNIEEPADSYFNHDHRFNMLQLLCVTILRVFAP